MVIKVAVVLAFIAFGAAYINRENWEPFVPAMASPGHFGWSGIVRAAGVIFFAYIGFDAVSTAAQETKNPQRDMPIGILGSLRHLHRALHRGVAGADRHRRATPS